MAKQQAITKKQIQHIKIGAYEATNVVEKSSNLIEHQAGK